MNLYGDWFRLALAYGIPLESCIRSHTARQKRTCLKLLDRMQDTPGTVESYLMQVAMEIRKTRAKYPDRIKMDHFRLKFQDREARTELSEQEQLERIMAAKRARYRRMGGRE